MVVIGRNRIGQFIIVAKRGEGVFDAGKFFPVFLTINDFLVTPRFRTGGGNPILFDWFSQNVNMGRERRGDGWARGGED